MADSLFTTEINFRQAAKAAGLTHYSNSVPCKHGHAPLRFVSDNRCVECEKTRKAVLFQRDKDKIIRRNREWNAKNKDKAYGFTKKWRAANKERFKQKQREWRESNPTYLERNRTRCASNRSKPENRLKARIIAKQWRKENLERAKATARAYAKKYPEKYRVYKHRRRSLMRNAEGVFTTDDLLRIRKMQRNRCALCKTKLLDLPKFIHIDHIIALSKGGTNWPRNLQLLCIHCNSSKNNTDQIEYMQSLGLLL